MAFNRNKTLPKRAVDEILTYVEKNSLPDCYSTVNAWLHDFYPDLNWDEDACVQDLREIMAHPEFVKIQAWFIKRYGFDFEAELNEELEDLW